MGISGRHNVGRIVNRFMLKEYALKCRSQRIVESGTSQHGVEDKRQIGNIECKDDADWVKHFRIMEVYGTGDVHGRLGRKF